MKKFYFVGGPKAGQAQEFFRRLGEVGGSPSGWRLYPHVGDGRALHLIDAESQDQILEHLHHFEGIYERSEIVEVVERRSGAGVFSCQSGPTSFYAVHIIGTC